MGKKKEIEEIRIFIESFGYKLIEYYLDNSVNRKKVIIEDRKGYRYNVGVQELRSGQGVSIVHRSNPNSLKNIILWMRLNNIEFELNKNNIYVSSHEKLEFTCKKCGEIVYLNWNNLSNGVGCGYCSGNRVGRYNNLLYLYPEISIEWNYDKNKKLPEDYTGGSNAKVFWKCKFNHEWKASISSRTNKKSLCPQCDKERKESSLQEKIRKHLNEKYDFTIKHERNCSIVSRNPKNNYFLPFDNEVSEIKLIIETHGVQHYEITNFHKLASKRTGKTPQEELNYLKWRDKYKKEYALSKGYYYLEIPYWEDDDKNTWKKSIDDKIKSIKRRE